MKTLYLLCGLAFSGKTTLGRVIVNFLHCPCISLDEINHERGLFGGEGIPVEEWEKTHQIAIAKLNNLMPLGQDILVDDTNCFRWLRDRFRALADQHSYQTKIIYLDMPLDEIRKRMQKNEATKKRHIVKESVFEELIKGFEPPQVDEDVLVFKQGDVLSDWLNSYLLTSHP